jgi:hypothetical protein
MKSRRKIANFFADVSCKRQKTERFDSLLGAEAKKRIRSYLDAYYLKDNKPGEWLFLEIAFFELYSLRASPGYQDLKTLLSNRIYKTAEVNWENFLLKLFFDKTTDPELIIYLLQNNNDTVVALSEAEMTIIIELLVKKEVGFIALLVKMLCCLIEKTVNSPSSVLQTCFKYLGTLEKIAFLKQSLADQINLKSIQEAKNFLKIMEEISESVIEPLKALCYWEIEIKRQLLRWIQDFFSKSTVAPSLTIDPICLEVSNHFRFFQMETTYLPPSRVQYSASSEPSACTKPVLT